MKKFLFCILVSILGLSQGFAQSDSCARLNNNSHLLCNNINLSPISTLGSTKQINEPGTTPVSCGSVNISKLTWLKTIAGPNAGIGDTIKVRFSNITTAIDIIVYMGACNALVPVACTTAVTGTCTLNIADPVKDSTYYIGIDDNGTPVTNMTVKAFSDQTKTVIALPEPSFNTNVPQATCFIDPSMSVLFKNLTDSSGGKIDLFWDFEGNDNYVDHDNVRLTPTPLSPPDYEDTVSYTFNAPGDFSTKLRARNECGTKGAFKRTILYDLNVGIEFTPPNPQPCGFDSVKLKGTGIVNPAVVPPIDPSITLYEWTYMSPYTGLDTIVVDSAGNSPTPGGFNQDSSVFKIYFPNPLVFYPPIPVKLRIFWQCGIDSTEDEIITDTFAVKVTADQEICQGQNLQPLDTICVGCNGSVKPDRTDPPGLTFLWSELPTNPAGLTIDTPDSARTTLTTLPNASGVFFIELLVMDANQPEPCTNRDTVKITINPRPIIDLGTNPKGKVCAFTLVPFNNGAGDSVKVTSGTPPYVSYLWSPAGTSLLSPADTSSSGYTIPNPIFRFCQTQIFGSLYVVDSKGCDTNSLPLQVYIYPPPTVEALPEQLCITDVPLKTTFTVDWPSGINDTPLGAHNLGNADSVKWITSPDYIYLEKPFTNPGAGREDTLVLVADFTPGVLGVGGVGTYNFEITTFNASTGCRDTLWETPPTPNSCNTFPPFNVYDSININTITSNKLIMCQGDSAQLNVTLQAFTTPPAGGLEYLWTSLPFDASLIGQNTIQNPLVKPMVDTKYSVTVTNGDAECFADTNISISVNETPIAKAIIYPNDTLCDLPVVISLGGKTSTYNKNPGIATLEWSNTNGANIIDITDVDSTVLTANAAPDIFQFVISYGLSGCSDTDRVNFVFKNKPAAFATINNDTVCNSYFIAGADTVRLNGTGSDTTARTTYKWTSNDPGVTFVKDDSIITRANNVSGSTIFTLTVTDSVGCDSAYSVTLLTYPVPKISSTVPSLCLSVADSVLFFVTGESSRSSYSGKSITPLTGVVFTALPKDSAKVVFLPSADPSYVLEITVKDSLTGCQNTIDTTFLVNRKPIVVPAILPSYTICQLLSTDTLLTLDGTGSSNFNPAKVTFLWSNQKNLANPITNNDSIVATCLATSPPDIFTLVITDTSTACTATANVSFFLNSKPAATASALPVRVCKGGSTPVVLTGTGSDARPKTTYSWSATPSAGIIFAPSATVLSPTANNVSAYTTFTLTVTDSVGCDSVFTVVVDTFPSPSLSNAPSAVCLTLADSAQFWVEGEGAGTKYKWKVSPLVGTILDPVLANAETLKVHFTIAGNYEISVVDTDGVTGCINKDTLFNFPVLDSVSLITSNDTMICIGDSAQLNASGAVTYLWTLDTGAPATALSCTTCVNPKASPTITTTYKVTASIGNCVKAKNVKITVNTIPVSTFTIPDTAICLNSAANMEANPKDVDATYNWDFDNESPAITLTNPGASGPFDVSWNTTGIKTISLFVVKNNCSSNTTTKTVRVSPLPTATFTLSSPDVCINENDTITYTGNVTGSTTATFNWDFGPNGVPATATGQGPKFVKWTDDGAQPITLTVTDTGCTSAIIIPTFVTVNPSATVDLGPSPRTMCKGGTIVLDAGTGYSAYKWDYKGTPNSNTDDTLHVKINTPTTTGLYNVTVTDNKGCTATDNVDVQEGPFAPKITFDGTGICQGNSLILDAGAYSPGTTYLWSPGGATTQTISVNSAIYFKVTVKDPNCPAATDSVKPNINPLPKSTFTIIGNTTICIGDDIRVDADTSGNFSYNWNFGLGGVGVPPNASEIIDVGWTSNGVKTVKLVVTDNTTTCKDSSTRNITVNTLPTPTITGSPVGNVCLTSTINNISGPNTAGYTYSWTSSTTDITFSTTTGRVTNVTANNVAPGTITLTVTDANGCKASEQKTITTLGAPISPLATSFCLGSSGILSLDTNNFKVKSILWTVNTSGTIVGANNLPNVTVKPTLEGANLYNIKIVYNKGTNECTIDLSATANATVPQILAQAETLDVCIATPIFINVPVADSTLIQSYSWTSIPVGFTSSIKRPQVTPPSTVPQCSTFVVVVTDNKGCVADDSVTVCRKNQIIAEAGANTSICIDDSSCITYQLNGTSSTALTYSWFNASLNPTTYTGVTPKICLPVSNFLNPSPKSYKIMLTASSPNCPNAKDSVTISFNDYPRPNAGGPYKICSGTVQLDGSGTFTTQLWTVLTPGGQIISGADKVNPVVQPSGEDTTMFLLTTNNATTTCSGKDTALVILGANIIPTLVANPASVCVGKSFTLTSSGGTTYEFFEEGISKQIGSSPTYTVLSADVNKNDFKVFVSANGCQTQQTALVMTINPIPIVSLVNPGNKACVGSPYTFSMNPATTPSSNWSWSPITGLDNPTNQFPKLVDPKNQSYKFVVTSTVSGCTSKDSVTFTPSPRPKGDPGSAQNACQGERIRLGKPNSDPNLTFKWTSIPPANILTDANSETDIEANANTTFTLTTTNSNNGCFHDTTVVVTVGTKLTGVLASSADTLKICKDASIQIKDAKPDPLPTGATVKWSSLTIPANEITNSQTMSPTITPTTKLKHVLIIAVTLDGCTTTDSVIINSNLQENANFRADSACAKDVTNFVDLSKDAFKWKWDFGDPASGAKNTDTTQNPNHNYSDGGTKTVTLKINEGTQCENSSNINIVVFGNPNAAFEFKHPNFPTYEFTNLTKGMDQVKEIKWDFGDQGTSNLTNPSHTYSFVQNDSFIVMLKIISKDGCRDSSSKRIDVGMDAPFDPINVQTPNGDGKNDFFVIKGIEVFQNSVLIVFNRWGKEVYRQKNYKNDWDAKEVPSGVYFFILEYNYKERGVIKDWLTIIK